VLPDSVSPAEARRLVSEGASLFDVREREEWDEVHVDGASLIPLDDLGEHLDEIPRKTDVILMCRSGRRSGIAQQTLRNAGFERVANLVGGIIAWEEDGLPVVRSNPAAD
jgi:rhodanese-related sulfurtransferase